MANTVFKLRRSSVAGKVPNTSSLAIGELALNLTDKKLYSSDGSSVWETGANLSSLSVANSSSVFLNVNSSVISVNTDININNNFKLSFDALSGSSNVYFIQQNDDNFVFYISNTSGGSKPVWSIYSNSATSNVNFSVPTTFSGNVTLGSVALSANGSTGSAGHVLTSNGTATYWVSPTIAATNTNAQFVWANTHTFQANVAFTGNNISVVSNTGSILFNGASDANWRLGRNTGSITKWVYTNNSIDIITANSTNEGFVIGLVSNATYFETGYLGTYVANKVTVGSSTSNATINSTAITANSISVGSSNTATFTNINGQINASADFRANAYAYFGGYGGNYLAFGQQTNFHQWIQSGFSSAGSPVYYSIILNPLGGNIGIGNTSPSDKLSVNGTTYLGGNVTLGSSGLSANGSYGSAGQSLLSNGSATYWATAGATLNANNSDTQTYYIGLSNASSGAWTNAVVSTTKLYYVPSTGKLDASIVNASSFTVGTAFTANATVVNAVSYYAGATLIANTTGPYGKTESNLNVNNSLTSNTASYLGNSSGTIANLTTWITGNSATAYTNAVSYTDGKIATANSAITGNAATAYTNAVSYVDGLKLDSVTNTSITYIPVANTVKNAYDRAIDANTRAASAQTAASSAYTNAVSYTDSKIATANSAITANAATAYTNAVSYTDSKIATANSAITGNAATAYTNAVSYTDSKIATANSAITGNAATAYTNAVSYVDGLKLDSVTNTSITYIPVANTVKNAYDRAIDANTRAASAQTAAASAYTNAVSYTDGKIATANSAITGNAATAYTNATTFASNATNITSGTLTYSVIPANVINTTAAFTISGVHTHSANIILGSSGVSSNGGFGTAGQVLHSNGTATYWATDDQGVTSVGTGNGLTGGTITTTGTVSVLANNGITANATGLYVTQGTGSVVNATGVHVNSTYIGTLSANNTTYVNGKTEGNLNVNSAINANNSDYLDGQHGSYYAANSLLANYALLAGATFSGDVTVNANLVVTGTTVTLNTATLDVKDKNITVAKGSTAAASDGAGITVDGSNIGLYYTYASNTWTSNVGITPSANVSFDIGSTALNWRTVYANSVTAVNVSGNGASVTSVNAIALGGKTEGNLNVNAAVYANSSSTNTFTVGTAAYHVANGNFGIGNSAPVDKLSVNGTTYLGANAQIAGSFAVGTTPSATYPVLFNGNANGNFVNGVQNSNTGTGTNVRTRWIVGSGAYTDIGMYPTGAVINSYDGLGGNLPIALTATSVSTSTNTFTVGSTAYVVANGFVGIGNSAPISKLHVEGTVYSTGDIYANKGHSDTVGSGSNLRLTSAIIQAGSANSITFWNYTSSWLENMRISSNGNVGIGTSSPTYKLQVNGSFAAVTKSFVIDHPSVPGKKLRYASLEGPENGVYVRGKLDGNKVIELPYYWEDLVDFDTITVNLTPIGRSQNLYVVDIDGLNVHIDSDDNKQPYCFYTVCAERKDVDKLVVEFDA